ncbi:MAG TPA: potassium/proton antiporter [Nitrospira sp.]|nr:potassium/proton antiporter [Nitrospira sp.]
MPIEYGLLGAALLLLLSVLGSLASARAGVPALILFLVIGMLAGSDGPGGIQFDYPWAVQSLGVIALSFILFSGGIDTDWQRARFIVWRALPLATIGVALTAVLVGWFATVVLGFSWLEGLLLGAIVSSTDAAAVFGILRSGGITLRGSLRELLELESGSNDPMAVLLTIGIIGLLQGSMQSWGELTLFFLVQMAVGTVMGYGLGRVIVAVMDRIRLENGGLYSVLSVALVLLTYSLTAALGGSGFLAVYLTGIYMGNAKFRHKRALKQFHEGLAWLMQIIMFLTLGLQVFPSRLVPVLGAGLLLSVFLMVIARPLATFSVLLPTGMPFKEQGLVAWVGLRGAVPIILATFPLVSKLPQADLFFHLVFFIVLTSVLLQGTSIPLVARWLRVERSEALPRHDPMPSSALVSGQAEPRV